jgi:hypothetical protein
VWPIARKVLGIVPLLAAIWCLSFPAPGVWQVKKEDLGREYRARMEYVGGEYSEAGLDEFVKQETGNSRTKVSDEAWETLFHQAEGAGSERSQYLYLPADTAPLNAWVNSDRPGYSVELPGKYPVFLWVQLYSTHSAMFNDDIPWGMTHPLAWLSPWLAGIGVLSYILLPWYRRKENEAVYSRLRSVIGPDMTGMVLAGCFMALPMFIITQIATHPRPLDFATSGAWFCLLFWFIAAIGAASFAISAWYEGLRFAITPEGISKTSLRGSREFAFSQMIEVKPMRIALPRWLRAIAWLVVIFNWRLAGPLLLGTSTANHGLEVSCRDGHALKVWAVHLFGYEQLCDALKEAGVDFQVLPDCL